MTSTGKRNFEPLAESPTIVVDHGSAWIKAGLSNEDTPRTLVGTENGKLVVYERSSSGIYVINNEKVSNLSSVKWFPIRQGMIADLDAVETIWRHAIFPGLHDHAETLPVLLSEQPAVTYLDRAKSAELMFEKFKVPSLCYSNQAVLSLLNQGFTTGISVDIGHGISNIVPIQDGHPVPRATIQMPISGLELTDMLHSLLFKYRKLFSTQRGKAFIQQMKEKHAYVALDYKDELCKIMPVTYDSPAGKSFDLGKEKIMCSEILFQPALNGTPSIPGIHKATRDAVNRCPDSVKEKLYSNILLTGGTCNLRNFKERFTNELSAIISKDTKLNVIKPPWDLGHSVWLGGALHAKSDYLAKRWIRKTDFDESGRSILY